MRAIATTRCGCCAADWPVTRLACPFCGEADADRLLRRFAAGDADRYQRVDCATCGRVLKVVATLNPLSAPGLLVAELSTVHLDLLDEPS